MNSEGQVTSAPIVEIHTQDASSPTSAEATTSTIPPASTESPQAEQPVTEESSNNNLESSSSESYERGSSYRGRKDRNWNNKRSMGKRRNYKDERFSSDRSEAPAISDPSLWPTLEQAVSSKNDSPVKDSNSLLSSKGSSASTESQSADEKQTSPRSEKNEDPSSKKKGIDWVPLKVPGPTLTRRPRDRERSNRRGKDGSERSASPSPSGRSTSPNGKTDSASSSNSQGTYNGRSNFRSSSRGQRGYSRGYSNQQWPYSYYPTVVLEEDHYNQALLQQIEYYFSVENLCRDVYLRTLMDKEGWVPVSTITNFNRVKAFQPETARLTEVVQASTTLEIKDNKIRRKEDWSFWILANSEAKPTTPDTPSTASTTTTSVVSSSSTTTSTTTTHHPEKKLTFGDIAAMGANLAPKQSVAPKSTVPSKPTKAETKPASKPHPVEAEKAAPQNKGSDVKESKKQQEDEWFTVAAKKKKNRSFGNSAPSSKKSEVVESQTQTTAAVDALDDKPEVPDPIPVGDFDESTFDQLIIVTEVFSKNSANSSNPTQLIAHFPTVIRSSKTKKNTLEKFTTSVGWTVHPAAKDPKVSLSEYEAIGQHRYLKYRENCMEKRKKLGAGKVEDMVTLYKFWSYFLRTHFNQAMYEDFKTCAVEDAKKNSRFGLDLLFQFFSFGLEIKYRDQVFEDFQELVLQDHQEGSASGLEKFMAYLRYKKDNVPLVIKPDLSKLLEKQKMDQKPSKKELGSSK